MDTIKTVLGREPVIWQTAVMAIINLLVVFNVIDISAAQTGALNTALAAVLGLVVRSVVTPLADPKININGTEVKLVPEV